MKDFVSVIVTIVAVCGAYAAWVIFDIINAAVHKDKQDEQ